MRSSRCAHEGGRRICMAASAVRLVYHCRGCARVCHAISLCWPSDREHVSVREERVKCSIVTILKYVNGDRSLLDAFK